MKNVLYSVLIIGLGVFCLVWAVRPYGCATTPDSAFYLAAARSFVEHGQFLSYDGSLMTLFPPFYPILLALCSSIAPLTPHGSPVVLGVVLYVGTMCLFGYWLRLWVATGWLSILGLAFLGFSTTMLLYMGALLSEAVFIFLISLFLVVAVKPSLSLESRIQALCAIASVAVLTRYIGIALYFLIGVFCLATTQRFQSRRHLWRTFLIGGVTTLPVGLYLYLNFALTGHLTGARGVAQFSTMEQIFAAFNTLSQFIFPEMIPSSVRIPALLLLFGTCFIVGASSFMRRQLDNSSRMSLVLILGWIATYLLVVFGLGSVTYMDMPDFRLMSPLLIQTLALLIFFADYLLRCCRQTFVKRFIIIGLIPFMALSVQRMVKICFSAHSEGLGMYTSRQWSEDRFIQSLKSTPLRCKLYSNAADAIYLNTLLPVSMLPPKGSGQDPLCHLEMGSSACVMLAWYASFWRQYTIKPADIAEAFCLEEEQSFRDCALYRWTKKPQ